MVIKALRRPWYQTVVPELCTPGFADRLVVLRQAPDMAHSGDGRRKHPVFWQGAALLPPPLEEGGQLPGDRQLQRYAGLGRFDAEDQVLPVHPIPPQQQHLVEAHAGVKAEPEGIPRLRR